MTDERHAAIQAALLLDHSNLNAIAKELHCTWRAVRDVWEGRVAGKRAVRDIVAERDAVRRSVLAEQDEKRQAEVIRIRDEILADYTRRMGQLDEREALVERRLAEYEAVVRETEARQKRLREAHVEHGRADGNAVRDQEALICRGNRNLQATALNVFAAVFTPEAMRGLVAAMRRDAAQVTTGRDAAMYVRLALSAAKTLAEAAEINARTERLVAGDPTHISRVDHTVTMEPTELRREYEAAVAKLGRTVAQLPEDAVLEEPEPLPALLPAEPDQATGCNAPGVEQQETAPRGELSAGDDTVEADGAVDVR
jgi:hypothetical protein